MDKYYLTSVFQTNTEKKREIGEQFYQNITCEFRMALDMPDDKKNAVLRQTIEIMKKLGKMADAIDRYTEEEEKVKQELIKMAKNSKSQVDLTHSANSVSLEGTVEDALSQAKASLDVMVKILDIIYGIKPHTYGKNGDDVIKMLQRNIPIPEQEKVQKIITLIEEFKPYCSVIIKLRTDSQHYGNLGLTSLNVGLNEKGESVVELPRIASNLTVKEFLNMTYHNIFSFVRDFLVVTLSSKFYSGLIPVVVEKRNDRVVFFGVGISPDITQSMETKTS